MDKHARRWIVIPALALSGLAFGRAAGAVTALENALRVRIEAGTVTESLEVGDERIHAREALRHFYPERAYRPVWVTGQGLTATARRFEQWLAREPARQGLPPRDYHLRAIEQLDDADRQAALVDAELALSDAFLMIGAHFVGGRVDPRTLDAEWRTNPRQRDLEPLLERVADGENPGALLEGLLPDAEAYRALVARLAELRELRDAGGWPHVELGPSLHEGDADPRVAAVARRLYLSGDFERADASVLDTALANAIRRFQARNGLATDGVVGPATLTALNVPVEERIDRIVVNLERWRWLPESLGRRYVLVNIAGFSLDAYEDGDRRLGMRVVVGTPYRRTPVFSNLIRYLVVNPSWEVPPKIAVQDKLPLIRRDPSYLDRLGFTVLQGWGADEHAVDPASIDWTSLSARNFPYRLRQAPGPDNALGRIKFMFPNEFSVYLHDTPARDLFAEQTRTFSSGCIRVAAPVDLAAWLLQDAPEWNRSAIETAIARSTQQMIMLPEPIPVHLLYWTAWVDTQGELNFRDDVYGRDAPVLRELREPPPE